MKPSDVDMRIAFVAVQGNIEVPISFHSSCGFSGTWKCNTFYLIFKGFIIVVHGNVKPPVCILIFVGFNNTRK